MRLPFAVDSARLSLALDVAFVRPRTDAPRLTVKGRRRAVEAGRQGEAQDGTDAARRRWRSSRSRIGESDLTAQKFHVENVLVSGLDVHVRRLRDGTLNLEHLAPGAGEPAAAPATARRPAERSRAPARRKRRDDGARFTVERSRWRKRRSTSATIRSHPLSRPTCATSRSPRGALSNAPGATAKIAIGLRAGAGRNLPPARDRAPDAARGDGQAVARGDRARPLRSLLQQARSPSTSAAGTLRLGTHYRLRARRLPQRRCASPTRFVGIADLALRRPAARDDFFRLAALDVRGAKTRSRRAHGQRRRDRHRGRPRACVARREGRRSI